MEEDKPQLVTGMDNVRARQAPTGFKNQFPCQSIIQLKRMKKPNLFEKKEKEILRMINKFFLLY
jgi:hypothetical protein